MVGGDELGECEGVGVVDDGDLQGVVALRVGHVDGQAESDVRELFDGGLAALEGVAHVEVGHLAQGFDERVADEVGERDFAADGACQVGVDEGPVFDEEFGGNLALGGGRWDGQRGFHVLGGGAGDGFQDVYFVLGGGSLGESEGGASVLQARVGTRGFGEGGGRGGRQVRTRDGHDGRVVVGGVRVLFFAVKVKCRWSDAQGCWVR